MASAPSSELIVDAETLAAFPYLRLVKDRWDSWCRGNAPSQDQLRRKVLVELWPRYHAAVQRHAPFDTRDAGSAGQRYRAICGQDLSSTAEYMEAIRPIVERVTAELLDEPEVAAIIVEFMIRGG